MLAHVCELTWGSAQNPHLTPLRGRFCLLVQHRGPLRPYGRNVNTQTCGKGVTGDPSAYTATLFSGRAGILQSNAETFRVVRHREVTVTGGHFPRFCDCSYLFPHSYRVQRFMFRSTDLQPLPAVTIAAAPTFFPFSEFGRPECSEIRPFTLRTDTSRHETGRTGIASKNRSEHCGRMFRCNISVRLPTEFRTRTILRALRPSACEP